MASEQETRQKQIEELGSQCEPPVPLSVLVFMDSIEKALSGEGPLTEDELSTLKPRLAEERTAAELKLAAAQSQTEPQKRDDEWETAQEPVRHRLDQYAEEYIQNEWNNGEAIDKINCPVFAAESLAHVRQRFYEDLAQADEELLKEGREPSPDAEGKPPMRTLLLESMKYIYDSKIRPITEKHRKEVFLCRDCGANARFYGFEGVIQHYAAKHTTVLTKGNIVVYWRAEWPEKSPFSLDRDALRREPFSRASSTAPGRFSRTPVLHSAYAPPPVPAIPRYASPMSDTGYSAYAQPYEAPEVNGHRSPQFTQLRSPPHASRLLASGYGEIIARSRMDELVRSSTDTWNRTAGIQDLTAHVRVYMMIYRAAQAFMERFHEEPSLALYTEVLRAPSMTIIAQTQGLMCRVCNGDSAMIPPERKVIGYIPLLNLFEHFLSSHEGRQIGRGAPASFKRDMVILPVHQEISRLQHSKGMDPEKMAVLAGVFSDLFPDYYKGPPRRHTAPYSPPHREFVRPSPPENIPPPWEGRHHGYRGKMRSISMQQPSQGYTSVQRPRPRNEPRGRSLSPLRPPPTGYRARGYEDSRDLRYGMPEVRYELYRDPPILAGPPHGFLPERPRDSREYTRSRSPRRHPDHYRARSPLAPERTYPVYMDTDRFERIDRPHSGPRSGQPSPGLGDRRSPYEKRPDSGGPRQYYENPHRAPHVMLPSGPPREYRSDSPNEYGPGYAGP